MQMTELRQLDYLAKGWSIIPLEEKGKRPLIEWTSYQTRLPTEEEVRQWWTKWPNANTGIVTGAVSGIAVIDIDGMEGENSALALSLPSTVQVKSGRGRHLYFTHPGTSVKNCVSIAKKVDIRGDGGYVVAPYSVHANGSIYAWVGGFGAIDAPLAPFPKNVLDLLSKPAQSSEYTPVGSQEPWVTELLKGVGDGEKHQALIRLAGYFNAKGLPLDVAKTLLLDWNTRNRPPADAAGIIERVEDVYKRYPAGSNVKQSNNVDGSVRVGAVITTPSASFAGFKEELTKGANTIKTGFSSLDNHTRGLLVGNLSVIGAWPGVGKTAFTLGLARSLAEQGHKVLYAPTEMAVNELMRVFVSQGLKIPFQRIMDGNLTEEEQQNVSDYLNGELLSRLSILPVNTPSLSDIREALSQTRPAVFMLDYLQHTASAGESRRLDISDMVMGLKELMKEYNCAGVVTSQFRRPYRDGEGDPIPPTLFDFSESGQIEREVSLALLMSPHEDRLTESMAFPVNFNIAKNRFGKLAEFQMQFKQEFVRFEEMDDYQSNRSGDKTAQ